MADIPLRFALLDTEIDLYNKPDRPLVECEGVNDLGSGCDALVHVDDFHDADEWDALAPGESKPWRQKDGGPPITRVRAKRGTVGSAATVRFGPVEFARHISGVTRAATG